MRSQQLNVGLLIDLVITAMALPLTALKWNVQDAALFLLIFHDHIERQQGESGLVESWRSQSGLNSLYLCGLILIAYFLSQKLSRCPSRVDIRRDGRADSATASEDRNRRRIHSNLKHGLQIILLFLLLK